MGSLGERANDGISRDVFRDKVAPQPKIWSKLVLDLEPHLRRSLMRFKHGAKSPALLLLLLVSRRHSDPERSRMAKNPRIFEGSVATEYLSLPPPQHRLFDRSCSQSQREQRSGETRFSTHTASNPNHRFVFACNSYSLLPYSLFFLVKPSSTLTPIQSTISTWRSSFTQPVTIDT